MPPPTHTHTHTHTHTDKHTSTHAESLRGFSVAQDVETRLKVKTLVCIVIRLEEAYNQLE